VSFRQKTTDRPCGYLVFLTQKTRKETDNESSRRT
jgi:hypothetical protein